MKRFTNILIGSILIFYSYSNNSFSQWVRTNYPSGAGWVNDLEVKGQYMFAGSQLGGIYVSTDNGMNWVQRNNGIANNTITDIAINGENVFACTYKAGVYKSTDNGFNWMQVYFNNIYEVCNTLYPVANNIFLGSMMSNPYYPCGGVHRSTDEGSTWVELTAGLPIRPDIRAYTFNGSFLLTASYGQVFRSSDYGENWEWAMNGLPSYPQVSKLNVNSTSVFMGSRGGYGIYRSLDNGLSWEAVNNGLPAKVAIGALGKFAGNVFAGTTDGVDIPYAYGIFISSDNGDNWIGINDGLPEYTNVRSITNNDTFIFLGTKFEGGLQLGGIWYRPLTELITDVKAEVSELQEEFYLSQNYPNPFNPITTISFSIPQSQNMELKVFDVLGNEIATLLNEYREAGEHKIRFSATGGSAFGGDAYSLPSGIYFYKLIAGDFIQTKKMLLIK